MREEKKKSACVYVFLWSGIHDLSSTQRAVINLYIVILVDLSWNCWFVLTSATSWRSLFCHSSRHYFEPVAVVATCILFFVAGTLLRWTIVLFGIGPWRQAGCEDSHRLQIVVQRETVVTFTIAINNQLINQKKKKKHTWQRQAGRCWFCRISAIWPGARWTLSGHFWLCNWVCNAVFSEFKLVCYLKGCSRLFSHID